MDPEPVQRVGVSDETAARGAARLVYILQAVGFFIGITWIAGAMVNYVNQDAARRTWVESHFRWQLRTFWFGLLWSVIGALTLWPLGLGYLIVGMNAVLLWLIYRVVKGSLNFNVRKSMYR
jgi:uncharacterized membrane protein